MKKYKTGLSALPVAFPHTLPILAGFGFIGLSYGIYMSTEGFSFIYPMLMSMFIFGGSLEFVTVTLLCGAFDPFSAFALALMIQARHLFYGISMLEKYKGVGKKKIYMIFGLCDESFSVNYTAKIPDDTDRGWFMFWVTLLDQSYWVAGATLGGILGGFISFNTKGIDFVMTAMFTVIFLEQLLKEKRPYTALIGGISSILCLAVFGAEKFLIPSMAMILLLITVFKKPLTPTLANNTETGGEAEE